MTKLRIVCASVALVIGLAGCANSSTSTGPTSVAPLASPAASGVTNPGYPGPSQAPAVAPDASYPAPSAAP